MSFANYHGLRPGDVVVVPKSEWKIIEHYVVYTGFSYGEHRYTENNRYEGVREITESRFAYENPKYFRIRRFDGNDWERSAAMERAYQLMGKKYDLTGFNCEDYANYVQFNKAFSKQSDNGVAIAAGVGLLLLFAGLMAGGSSNNRR